MLFQHQLPGFPRVSPHMGIKWLPYMLLFPPDNTMCSSRRELSPSFVFLKMRKPFPEIAHWLSFPHLWPELGHSLPLIQSITDIRGIGSLWLTYTIMLEIRSLFLRKRYLNKIRILLAGTGGVGWLLARQSTVSVTAWSPAHSKR